MKLSFAATAVIFALMIASSTSAQTTRPSDPLTDGADPTAVRDGDWWYVYTSGHGILARRTRDFVAWEVLPPVFAEPLPAWAKAAIPQAANIWAPDITKVGGRYLMVYHCSFWGSQKSVMGLVSATSLDPKSPDYGWTDHGLLIDSDPARGDDFNAIDGSIALDRDGKPWLVWGSYWTGVKISRMSDDGLKVLDVKDRVGVATAKSGPEGPQVTYRDGWYYLFCSYAGGPDYQVRVGRSKEITGPYLDRQGKAMTDGGGTPVTKASPGVVGPGHHTLALGDDRFGDLLLCHVFNRYSRDVYVADLMWDADGWPCCGERYVPAGKPVKDVAAWLAAHRYISILDGAHIGSGGYRWITFAADGTVAGVTASNGRSSGTWTLAGHQLTMKWPAADAPNGAWTDVVMVSKDGTHFAGRNDKDVDVRGSMADLHEWRAK